MTCGSILRNFSSTSSLNRPTVSSEFVITAPDVSIRFKTARFAFAQKFSMGFGHGEYGGQSCNGRGDPSDEPLPVFLTKSARFCVL